MNQMKQISLLNYQKLKVKVRSGKKDYQEKYSSLLPLSFLKII